jgi:hypothetical protein
MEPDSGAPVLRRNYTGNLRKSPGISSLKAVKRGKEVYIPSILLISSLMRSIDRMFFVLYIISDELPAGGTVASGSVSSTITANGPNDSYK